MAASRPYVVMTYARCGATFLAQLLGSTGCLGRPEDWFNGQGYRARGYPDYPRDHDGQRDMWRSKGASPNNVVGLKLSALRLDELQGYKWAEGLGDIRFIHLTRNDRLARAISDTKAQQTRQYRSTSKVHGIAHYDAPAIRRNILTQSREEARIRSYFAKNGIDPLELTYEQLIEDETAVLGQIAALLGVNDGVQADYSQIELKVQRDVSNAEWADRFVTEHRDLAQLDPFELSIFERIWRRLRG